MLVLVSYSKSNTPFLLLTFAYCSKHYHSSFLYRMECFLMQRPSTNLLSIVNGTVTYIFWMPLLILVKDLQVAGGGYLSVPSQRWSYRTTGSLHNINRLNCVNNIHSILAIFLWISYFIVVACLSKEEGQRKAWSQKREKVYTDSGNVLS